MSTSNKKGGVDPKEKKSEEEVLENHASEDTEILSSKIVKGLGWSGASTVFVGIIGMITNLVLARILDPESFGIVFMAMVFTGLFQVAGELGLAAALIQKKSSDLTSQHFHTAFWSGLLMGIAFYLIAFFLIAPLAAWFFEESLLIPVIRLMGLTLLIRPFFVIHRVVLTRNMHFSAISIAESLSILLASIVTISLAIRGWGVWSLALQNVLMASFALPAFYWFTKYTPLFQFSQRAFKSIFTFSMAVTGNNVMNYATNNIDNVLVGRFAGGTALGIYGLIFMITDTFRSYLMSIMNKVMFPVYGKLQDETKKLKNYYLSVIRYNTLAIFPAMILLIVYAKPILLLGFGENWVSGTFPLQMLALSVMVHAVGGTSASVMNGMGKAGLQFRISMVTTFGIAIPALVIGVYFWGIAGAAVAVLIKKVASRLIFQFYLKRLINVSEKEITLNILPALIPTITCVLFALAWNTYFTIDNLQGLILGILGLLIFYSIIALFSAKKEIKNLIKFYIKG